MSTHLSAYTIYVSTSVNIVDYICQHICQHRLYIYVNTSVNIDYMSAHLST